MGATSQLQCLKIMSMQNIKLVQKTPGVNFSLIAFKGQAVGAIKIYVYGNGA
jgi:hypothetical protein